MIDFNGAYSGSSDWAKETLDFFTSSMTSVASECGRAAGDARGEGLDRRGVQGVRLLPASAQLWALPVARRAMSDAHRRYVIGTENGCDDLDEEEDPKVEGGMDANEYLETLSRHASCLRSRLTTIERRQLALRIARLTFKSMRFHGALLDVRRCNRLASTYIDRTVTVLSGSVFRHSRRPGRAVGGTSRGGRVPTLCES